MEKKSPKFFNLNVNGLAIRLLKHYTRALVANLHFVRKIKGYFFSLGKKEGIKTAWSPVTGFWNRMVSRIRQTAIWITFFKEPDTNPQHRNTNRRGQLNLGTWHQEQVSDPRYPPCLSFPNIQNDAHLQVAPFLTKRFFRPIKINICSATKFTNKSYFAYTPAEFPCSKYSDGTTGV